MRVRFNTAWCNYGAGAETSLDDGLARQLINRGIVALYNAPQPISRVTLQAAPMLAHAPPLYVLIVTHGRPKECRDQIDRILPQLDSDDRLFCLIDGCPETEAAFADGTYSREPRLCLYRFPKRQGADKARQALHAEAPPVSVIVELDDHDPIEAKALAEIRKVFMRQEAQLTYCDIALKDAKTGKESAWDKPSGGGCREHGNLGMGLRAYRASLYRAVGGYPTEYYPANDVALLCMMEQASNHKGMVHIPKRLVRVMVNDNGISMRDAEQQADAMRHVCAIAGGVGFKLPQPPARFVPKLEPFVPVKRAVERPGVRKPHAVLVTEVAGSGRGGGELSMMGLLHHAARNGYAISILYQKDAGEEPLVLDWARCVKLPLSQQARNSVMPAMQAAAPQIEAALRELRPDILVTEVRTAPSIIDIGKTLNVPVVTVVQFWHHIIKPTDAALDRMNERPLPVEILDAEGIAGLKQSTALIANSEYTAGIIREALRREPDSVIYPPIALDRILVKDPKPLTERKYIVCPSVQWRKGSKIFLALAERHPNLNFWLLAGDNRHSREGDVLEKAATLPNVRVSEDWIPDMRTVYSDCRLMFIGTTTCESFCRAAAEARANGIPILASDAGNLVNIVRKTAGIVVPRKADIEEWDRGLERVWRLRPEPMTKFCRDQSPKFVTVLGQHRLLSEIAILRPTAIGMSVGAEEFQRKLGLTTLAWDTPVETLEHYALTIIPGTYRPEISERHTGSVAYWWCSHFAQMDTNRHEMKALLNVAREVREHEGRYLFLTRESDIRAWLPYLGQRVRWLPNVMTFKRHATQDKLDGPHVWLPGPYGERKNIYAALAACAIAKAEAHCTARINEQAPELTALASALDVKLHIHECAERADVLAAASQCGAALMVSMAETYCYGAAEAVMCGLPTVASVGIPTLRNSPDALLINDPGDVNDIAAKLVIAFRDEKRVLAASQYEAVEREIDRRNAAARALLREITNKNG